MKLIKKSFMSNKTINLLIKNFSYNFYKSKRHFILLLVSLFYESFFVKVSSTVIFAPKNSDIFYLVIDVILAILNLLGKTHFKIILYCLYKYNLLNYYLIFINILKSIYTLNQL